MQLWLLLRTRVLTAAWMAWHSKRLWLATVNLKACYRKWLFLLQPAFHPARTNGSESFVIEADTWKNRNNSTGPQFISELSKQKGWFLRKFFKPAGSFTAYCASSLESPRGIFSPWHMKSCTRNYALQFVFRDLLLATLFQCCWAPRSWPNFPW